MLSEYLASTRADITEHSDATPVCLGNYTDMLMSDSNREFLLSFAREMVHAKIVRPLVVVSKGYMPRTLAESLNALDVTIAVFHSQSFHRTTVGVRTETGPVLTPDQTLRACAVYTGLDNMTPVHFWRPITRKSVPSAAWAMDTVRRLKESGYRCSVAIGLAVGVGIAQEELIDRGLLDGPSAAAGEIWDRAAWEDILSAAEAVDYPVYRSTSCAIALATRQPEALGVWDRRRGADEKCAPCNCPTPQRALCESKGLQSGGVERPLAWLADQLGRDPSRLHELPGRRVSVEGDVPQSMISLALHKYQIELLPESISSERAWLGSFGKGDTHG